jgi:hypothetical protein
LDPQKLLEFELTLNRLGTNVVKSALDKLTTHPERKRYVILGFTAGSSESPDNGIKLRRLDDGNYSFRISGPALTSLFGPCDQTRYTFTEIGIRGATVGDFVEVLTDVLRQQGREI